MSRKFKIAAGATVAAALLIGASATMAAWQVDEEIAAAPFSVGFLAVDGDEAMAPWRHLETDRDPDEVAYVVPGDEIFTYVNLELTGQGDHLCIAIDADALEDFFDDFDGVTVTIGAIYMLPEGGDPDDDYAWIAIDDLIDMTCGEEHVIPLRVRIDIEFLYAPWDTGTPSTEVIENTGEVWEFLTDEDTFSLLFQQQDPEDCMPFIDPAP
jgi:hypothetical protein